MIFFFDTVMGLTRVRDPEGADFANITTAMTEAHKIAAEITIEELRNGCRVGADWRIEVLDLRRSLQGSILFYEAVLDPPADAFASRMMRRHFLGTPDSAPAYQRSFATLEESRAIAANVRAVFREMKQRLDQLA